MPRGRHPKEQIVETSSSETSEDEDFLESSDEDTDVETDVERVFCKCGKPNNAQMIGCDWRECQYEWFHFECVGIDPTNIPRGRWLCDDCFRKQEEEEAKFRIPAGQFVFPVAAPSTQPSNDKAEEENCATEKEIAPEVPNDTTMPSDSAEEEIEPNSPKELRTLTPPTTTASTETSTVSDGTLENSLSKAEKELASNLKQASDAVIHGGKSIGDAAKQFRVGRYVLGDCVKDQVKFNLDRAFDDVISKKYTVPQASMAYGVLQGILQERVRIFKSKQHSTEGRQTVSEASFEENLQQACMDVMLGRFSPEEACRTYKMHTDTLQARLRSVLVLTSAEENDLVATCFWLHERGLSSSIKNSVMGKVKELLDKEEKYGIKRLHSFLENKPDDFWWDAFCRRHPGVKVLCDTILNGGSVGSQVTTQNPTNLDVIPSNATLTMTQPRSNQALVSENVCYILPSAEAAPTQLVAVQNQTGPVPGTQTIPIAHEEVISTALPPAPTRPKNLTTTNQVSGDNVANVDSIKSTDSPHESREQSPDISLDKTNPPIENMDLVAAHEIIEEDTMVVGSEIEVAGLDIGANEVVSNSSSRSASVSSHEMEDVHVAVSNETTKLAGSETGVLKAVPGKIKICHDTPTLEKEILDAGVRTGQASAVVNLPTSDTLPVETLAGNSGVTKPGPLLKPGYKLVVTDQFLSQPALQNSQPNMLVVANKTGHYVEPTTIFVPHNKRIHPNQILMTSNVPQTNLIVGNASQPPVQRFLLTKNGPVVGNSNSNVTMFLPNRRTSGPIQASPITPILANPTPTGHQMPSTIQPIQSTAYPIPLSQCGHPVAITAPQHLRNSGSPKDEKVETRVFVAKHKINKNLPDPLSRLENTLTQEQKEMFAFRLQIGDTRQDDLVYNAWKALKRLYQYKDIYSLYDKKPSPKTDQSPENFDVPVATKLMDLPLMDPESLDEKLFAKGKHIETSCSNMLGELYRARKRKRMASVLARKKAKSAKCETRKFLEPFKHRVRNSSKRKCYISKYAGNALPDLMPDESDESDSEESTSSEDEGNDEIASETASRIHDLEIAIQSFGDSLLDDKPQQNAFVGVQLNSL